MTRGQILRSAREALGLTQRDVAERVPVSLRTVRKWEADTASPTASNLTRLVDVLGLDLADIDGID